MKSFNEWMNLGRAPRGEGSDYYFNRRVVCADGFSISIQANEGAYCRPRRNLADIASYSEFELGFPSERDALIMSYAESPDVPEGTVYAYVPRVVVEKLLQRHGGIMMLNSPKDKE